MKDQEQSEENMTQDEESPAEEEEIVTISTEVTKRVEWPPAATGSESEAEVAREENLEKEKSDKSGVDANDPEAVAEGRRHLKTFVSNSLLYHNSDSNMTSTQQMVGYGREIFRPGKLNMSERYNPGSNPDNGIISGSVGRPKLKLRTMDDIVSVETKESSTGKRQSCYYAPPGTSRTKMAQQMYKKHLQHVEESSIEKVEFNNNVPTPSPPPPEPSDEN